MLLPVFSEESVPGQVRLLLAVGMTAGLFGLLRGEVAPLAGQADAELLGTVLTELATGLAFGMLVKIFFQAAAMAGSLVSLQIGLALLLHGLISLVGATVALALARHRVVPLGTAGAYAGLVLSVVLALVAGRYSAASRVVVPLAESPKASASSR